MFPLNNRYVPPVMTTLSSRQGYPSIGPCRATPERLMMLYAWCLWAASQGVAIAFHHRMLYVSSVMVIGPFLQAHRVAALFSCSCRPEFCATPGCVFRLLNPLSAWPSGSLMFSLVPPFFHNASSSSLCLLFSPLATNLPLLLLRYMPC
jgi:hypothetical protein